MQIRMMTFHTPINYGAALQAYALQTYLKSQCEDVKIIDYKPDTLIQKYKYFKKNNSIKNIINNIVKIKDYKKYKLRKQKFDEFANKYFDLTERVIDKQGIENQVRDADFVFTGSDQVFNPTRKHEEETDNFYLNFDVNKAKRVAYAPSFGVSSIPIERQETVRKYLEQFDYLSARELEGKKIIKDLTNRESLWVVDPVLLINEKQWEEIEQKVEVPEKYLLCYSLYECELEKKIVEKVAQKLNLKVVLITHNTLPKMKYDKCFKNIGPKEFLYLMRNAQYIVSDSFHAIVFATIFKKQFSLAIAKEETKSRMTSYLHRIGLDNRLCLDADKINLDSIDYNKVNEKLDKEIKLSKKYIENCLNSKDLSELNDIE